ncbi:neuronal acetylcholine receptor subunit beta-3-like [Mercenaria mercenaria]|uniref:neuronal acetylcholine receptor subunit beta-3-like n=1 Tax=Mercenaria mercenaria TaxID=6596 RepID=UPI00234E87AA|nr:neuronal acetylcholine receptor subunit beta-3-like [Mercenaria mercenaria]
MFTLVGIFIFGITVGTTQCQTYDDVLNLRTTLLTSYDADILPLDDQSDSLNINLTMVIFKMPEVDPVRGAISMGIMVTQEWYDERLTWTPADHNGTMGISIKSEDVWTPPLTVANPVTFTLLDTSWMQVMIMADGKMSYTVGGIIEFSCTFYMKFWPFDKHICSIHLFPYGYPASKVTFAVPGTVVDTGIYTENGEWFLDEDSFEYKLNSIFGMTRVVYSFKIARLSSFYVLTVILPIFGVGALTCLVFLLPSESGERVGYAITIMLTLAVFMTITSEDLPKNGAPIPVIFVYILFNLIVCIGALLFVILNLMIYHRTEKVPMANFYKSIVRFSRRSWCRRKVQDETDERKNSISNSKDMMKSRKIFVSDLEGSGAKEDEDIEWKEVSEAIDKLMFYAMVIVTFVPSIIILVYTAAASEYIVES